MTTLVQMKRALMAHLDPAGKYNFLRTLPRGGRILDVGCGNRSASRYKAYRGDIEYVGIDVSDYAITDEDRELMAEYVVCPPSRFAESIRSTTGGFDAVISAHNLEHCDDPIMVLDAMCGVLREGGRLHLSFPSEASRGFPSRRGTLNFHDDPTHMNLPEFDGVLSELKRQGLRVERQVRRNRGALPWFFLLGLLQEPRSRRAGKVLRGTWYFWGFESIIVARRP